MRRDGMWSRRNLGANSAMHGVMVMQRRLRRLSISGRDTINPTPLRRRNRTRPSLVRGMIEQPANVVNEEWIKLIRDLFLVGKIQCSIEWNPWPCQYMSTTAALITYQTPFRCIGPIFTT
jgi:hypothetical protein